MKKFFVGSVGLLIFLCSSVFAESNTIYLGKDFEIEIQDDGTRIERIHIFAGNTKVSTIETTRRENEEPVTRTIYHHEDHLTGANVDTDENRQVIQLSDYYPYGENRIDEHDEDYHNDYQFTGKERDEETGLSYYGARYYDSATGRFISRDPWEGDLRDPQSLNKYGYVKNNPLKYVDPTGEKVEVVGSAFLAGRALHSFLKITPDHPEDFGLPKDSSFTIGAGIQKRRLLGGNLTAAINRPNDLDALKGEYESIPVGLPSGGKDDSSFINNILGVYGRYGNNEDYAGVLSWGGYNCHNFTSSILEGVGAKDVLKGFNTKRDSIGSPWSPGLGKSIPSMLDSRNDNTVDWRKEFQQKVSNAMQNDQNNKNRNNQNDNSDKDDEDD